MRAHTLVGSAILATGIVALVVVGCQNQHEAKQEVAATGNLGASSSIKDLMKERGLSESDVESALKTYVPTGKMDEYYIFAS